MVLNCLWAAGEHILAMHKVGEGVAAGAYPRDCQRSELGVLVTSQMSSGAAKVGEDGGVDRQFRM